MRFLYPFFFIFLSCGWQSDDFSPTLLVSSKSLPCKLNLDKNRFAVSFSSQGQTWQSQVILSFSGACPNEMMLEVNQEFSEEWGASDLCIKEFQLESELLYSWNLQFQMNSTGQAKVEFKISDLSGIPLDLESVAVYAALSKDSEEEALF